MLIMGSLKLWFSQVVMLVVIKISLNSIIWHIHLYENRLHSGKCGSTAVLLLSLKPGAHRLWRGGAAHEQTT